MSRGLTTAQINALTAETVRMAYAVALELDSGTTRLTTAPYDLVLDGDTFVGALVAEVSEVEETAELSGASMSVAVSGIPRDLVTVAMDEPFQGRRATVWVVLFDESWVALDPFILFRGRIDQMQVTMGATARIEVSLVSRLIDWERASVARYSDEEQRQRHPGDVGFQYAAAMVTKEVNFPNAAWFRSHPRR